MRAAFERVTATDRMDLVRQVCVLVDQLQASGLRGVIPKATILRFAVAALARSEVRAEVNDPSHSPDFAGYRALRSGEQRVSLAYATMELALRITPDKPSITGSAEELVGGVASFIAALPDELRRDVVALDLRRIDRAVSLLESWWMALAMPAADAEGSEDRSRIENALSALAESKFFQVTREEGALLRFALEARVVADLFPEAAERVEALRARIANLEVESARVLAALRRGRSDAAWAELFDRSAKPKRGS